MELRIVIEIVIATRTVTVFDPMYVRTIPPVMVSIDQVKTKFIKHKYNHNNAPECYRV